MSSNIRPEETLAAELIESWLQGRGTVTTMGNGDTPDLRIDYTDKPAEYVEIKQDVHEGKAALRSLISTRLSNQSVYLGEGIGTWWFLVNEKFQVSEAREIVSHAITLKMFTSSSSWEPAQVEIATTLGNFCEQNGITEFRRVELSTGENRAYIIEKGHTGMISRDANSAISWIVSLISRDSWIASFQRVTKWSKGGAHLFFWVQSGTPEEIALMWSFIEDDVPENNISLPDGIKHIWISSFLTFSNPIRAWHFEVGRGWEMIYTK